MVENIAELWPIIGLKYIFVFFFEWPLKTYFTVYAFEAKRSDSVGRKLDWGSKGSWFGTHHRWSPVLCP